MNKRKLMLVAVALCMAAILLAGGTLAYLTDTDTDTNVFTVGNVKIDLHEKNNDGAIDEAYHEWLEDQILMPGTKTNNNIAKNVYVENTGNQPAYIWVEIGVPVELDDIDNASNNSLHFNYDSDYALNIWMKYLKTENGYNYYILADKDGVAIQPEAFTDTFMYQVYMDERVASCETHTDDDGICFVLADGSTHYKGEWDLVVNAIGFQAQGFTVEQALTEYYQWNSFDWSEWK